MNLEKLAGHAAMFGANAMWGVMSPVSKMVMAGSIISPMVVTDCRVLGAAILFWVLSLFMKKDPVAPKDLLLLLLASQCAIVFNQGSFVFGVSLTSPIDASIITTSLPIPSCARKTRMMTVTIPIPIVVRNLNRFLSAIHGTRTRRAPVINDMLALSVGQSGVLWSILKAW